MDAMQQFKLMLDHWFKLKDLGDLRFFLGLEVAESSKGIFVSQHPYLLQLLEHASYLGSKTSKKTYEA